MYDSKIHPICKQVHLIVLNINNIKCPWQNPRVWWNNYMFRRRSVNSKTILPQIASSWGQHEAALGPVGLIWAPCRPHEPCNQGRHYQHKQWLGECRISTGVRICAELPIKALIPCVPLISVMHGHSFLIPIQKSMLSVGEISLRNCQQNIFNFGLKSPFPLHISPFPCLIAWNGSPDSSVIVMIQLSHS